MLNAYLTSLANQLDKAGRHEHADTVDNIRIAQALTMPVAEGVSYNKAVAVTQEVEKLAAQQASMFKNVESELTELKNMRGIITKGARDFWRFRRSKYQQKSPTTQTTNLGDFGLRGIPAPQMRKSQAQPPLRTSPAQSVAPFTDEVEEFFQWLEAEQVRKMQQNNGMGANMNLPFQIG